MKNTKRCVGQKLLSGSYNWTSRQLGSLVETSKLLVYIFHVVRFLNYKNKLLLLFARIEPIVTLFCGYKQSLIHKWRYEGGA